MRFPKRSLRSVARKENLKLAIVEVKDELQRQLKQYKEKFQAKTKRRARAFKKELKISPAARFYKKGRIREEGI
jgi:ribosome-associated translation inhibitor RaiA